MNPEQFWHAVGVWLSAKPSTATVAELRVEVQKAITDELGRQQADRTVCRNCERPITKDVVGRWVHLDPDDGLSNIGCRAASFEWLRDADGGWDENLNRHLKAAPTK